MIREADIDGDGHVNYTKNSQIKMYFFIYYVALFYVMTDYFRTSSMNLLSMAAQRDNAIVHLCSFHMARHLYGLNIW